MLKNKAGSLGYCLVGILAGLALSANGESNRAKNPSFEAFTDPKMPTEWSFCERFEAGDPVSQGFYVWDEVSLNKRYSHSGQRCVLIDGKGKAAWMCSGVATSGVRNYTLSAWVKSTGVKGEGYRLEVVQFADGKPVQYERSEFNNQKMDWTKISLKFTTLARREQSAAGSGLPGRWKSLVRRRRPGRTASRRPT